MKLNKLKLNLALFTILSCGGMNAQSPYISKVYDFMPAPGQFTNDLPKYEQGDTKASIINKVNDNLKDNNRIMVSLGGYGGYVVVGFDHTIVNMPDSCDFKVLGNAFWAAANPNLSASKRGGSCEPGIVMVSVDTNKNGLPDDVWYELAGSQYDSTSTIKKYRLTYYKPDENKIRTPYTEYPSLNDTTYIKWKSNQGDYGYVSRNIYHSQSYWPQWFAGDSIVFEGTKLANNYVDESGKGSYYVQYSYAWGYADNAPNTDPMSNMDIAWAVDKNGNKVNLAGIDFVKIYTGVNQYCGWLGETSTEVMGVTDLHPNVLTSCSMQVQKDKSLTLINNPIKNTLIIGSTLAQTIRIYSIGGQNLLNTQICAGTNYVDCSCLSSGIYLLKSTTDIIKFIKQ